MKILGIIAEFNPFHNGHKYLIDTCMKNTGADFCVIAMSGNFVQRGTAAIMSYRERTEMALKAGASAVILLDSYTSTGSAEFFASGAVKLFNALGCVDYLAFGTEEGELEPLKRISNILAKEDDRYKAILLRYLSKGYSFPAAREKTLAEYGVCDERILESPNNILAVEYLKAIERTGSNIEPYTISRKDSDYNSEITEGKFTSARSIRNLMEKTERESDFNPSDFNGFMPEGSVEMLNDIWKQSCPISADDFSAELGYVLRMNFEKNKNYFDISDDLEDRIISRLDEYRSFSDFTQILKSKNRTYSSVSRALTHILLNMKQKDFSDPYYLRIIGCRKDSMELISHFSKNSKVPVIMRSSDAKKILTGKALEFFKKEMQREFLYETKIAEKFRQKFRNPYKERFIKI